MNKEKQIETEDKLPNIIKGVKIHKIKVPYLNYTLKDCIKDSDVDGRKILFQFTDSDIPILLKEALKIIDRLLKSKRESSRIKRLS